MGSWEGLPLPPSIGPRPVGPTNPAHARTSVRQRQSLPAVCESGRPEWTSSGSIPVI